MQVWAYTVQEDVVVCCYLFMLSLYVHSLFFAQIIRCGHCNFYSMMRTAMEPQLS